MAPGVHAELEGARIVDIPLCGRRMAVHTPGSRIPSHGTDTLGQRCAFDLIRFDPRKGARYHPRGGLRVLLLGIPNRGHEPRTCLFTNRIGLSVVAQAWNCEPGALS